MKLRERIERLASYVGEDSGETSEIILEAVENFLDIRQIPNIIENSENLSSDFQVTKKNGKKYNLKEIIVDLIYTADWEIGPRPVNGIDTHKMINEDDVVQEIIDVVLESLK